MNNDDERPEETLLIPTETDGPQFDEDLDYATLFVMRAPQNALEVAQ